MPNRASNSRSTSTVVKGGGERDPSFSAAYIHESTSTAWMRFGWVKRLAFMLTERRQAAKFRNCSATCGMHIRLAMTVSDVPIPLDYKGRLKKLTLEQDGKIRVVGNTFDWSWSGSRSIRGISR